MKTSPNMHPQRDEEDPINCYSPDENNSPKDYNNTLEIFQDHDDLHNIGKTPSLSDLRVNGSDTPNLSTGTSNPHQHHDGQDPMFGNDPHEFQGQGRGEFIHFENNHPDLDTFLESVKGGTKKQKIALEFKNLGQIKQSMKSIQYEWNLRSSNIFGKKIN